MNRLHARRAVAVAAALLALAGLYAHLTSAQHATPAVNGSIAAGEYGDHTDGQNAKSNGGTTWYMTWDETNLYVGLSGANTAEGAVIYIDRHPPLPNSGTNADGNSSGQTYDSTNFAALPFRADFVTYYKDGYREYRTADGAGNWSAPTTGFGAYASDGVNVRELAIPWSAVTGAGRPVNFSFFAYATSPGGFVYGEVPPENPDGFIGTSAVATRFYHVASTANGASTKPFSLNFTSSTRTFVVNSTADGADAAPGDNLCQTSTPGQCTLRAAIEEANAVLSVDTINFLILPAEPNCTAASVCTISPASALPAATDPVYIEGYTQTGASPNTLAVGDDAVIKIELNGSGAGAGADGLRFTGGSSALRGLAIYSFTGDGVELSGAGANTVAGNFIGHTSLGATVTGVGNAGDGVNVSGAPSNTVGGSAPAARNLIAQNAVDGVDITGTNAAGNTVAGNYIGTDRNGTGDFGNFGNGVFLSAPSNTVGGSTATPGQGAGNVISGNTLAGVRITTNGNSNTVAGNLIGTQSNGTAALANSLEGVFITNAATSNTVGGATSDLRNVISGNNSSVNTDGVEINGSGTNTNTVAGNYIGLQINGTTSLGNGGNGVLISAGAQSNTVGGTSAGARNVIGGHTTVGSGLVGDGVEINGSGTNSNVVAGNYIGTNAAGTAAVGNVDGVRLAAGAQSNSIGGLTSTPGTAPGNVISGNNSDGVEISGSLTTSNTIRGNLIGLAAGGTALVRNTSNGVLLSNAPSNTVGGATATARNVITGGTGSTDDGVDIQTSDNTVVAGNYIGTDINGAGTNGGASDFGAGGDGVRLVTGSDNNTIGGSTTTPGTAPGNVISGNGSDGVEIAGTNSSNNSVQGNLIGTQANGTAAYGNGANGVNLTTTGATGNTVGGSTTTPGTGVGNVISGNGSDGVEITVDGVNVRGNLIGLAAGGTAALGNGANGVFLNPARLCTIGGATSDLRNVISANGTNGVQLNEGSVGPLDSNTVAGNYIGTDINGTADLGNTNEGVLINGGDGNTVGGLAATPGTAPGNVISGNNSDGVELINSSSNTNAIRGNLIGTNAAGTSALPNTGDGVGVRTGVASTTVGGTAAGARNVISANGSDGIELASGGHTIQGNFIGTQADGATALGNTAHGVHNSAATVTATSVGGTAAGAGNTIAFNGGDGVFISAGVDITVSRNSIHSNAGLGIDLGPDGVTPNDTDDPDTGANNLQNFPVITSATQGSTIITGTLNSTPSTTFTVEFFSSPTADPTAHGEGQTFLDSISVTTDANGDAAFSHTVATTVPTGQVVTATATDPSGNTSEFSNTRQVLAATAARLREFTAHAFDGGVLLEWQTAFEVDNLGFQLYREEPGGLVPVNSSLVAGSALTTNAVLTAGQSYSWLDRDGRPGARYYLEDVDTDGVRTLHGPFWPAADRRPAAKPRSPLLSQLGERTPEHAGAQRQFWEALTDSAAAGLGAATGAPAPARGGKGSEPRVTPRTGGEPENASAPKISSAAARQSAARAAASLERQRELAAGPAVKLSVRRTGWHRVTRAELEAAGLSPAADPTRLQLYADGRETAVRLDAAAWLAGAGALEFYGAGLDTPSTDARVYWLVEGTTPGRRIVPGKPSASAGGGWQSNVITIGPVAGADFPRSFGYTLELKERHTYFAALLNGDGENFFGRVVGPAGLAQTLDVRHLDRQVEIPAQLHLALQGVTNVPHEVHVELNGLPLGAVTFAGRERATAQFPLSPSLLREGANELRLRAAGGASDVSLTDYARLGYTRLMRADSDRLWFPGHGGASVRVGGFSTPDVRVVDVTDPEHVEELVALVEPAEGGGFAATVTPGPGTFGARTLLAFTAARVEAVASARANAPSNLAGAANAADYLVITRAEMRAALAPLVARRAAEGLAVAVVDVEDVFDEFSYGAHTPQAVRDFLAAARGGWARAPRYLLLAGDGSYDPRDYLGRGFSDLVPARLVDTKSMETVSDEWFADFDGDGLSEMAVGRLPVRTPAEAALVAAKIAGHVPEEARRSVLLVADRRGADGFDFEAASAELSALVPAGFEVDRVNRGAQDAATVRSQIVEGIGEGQLVVNYLGHGSVNVWTGEGLLRNEDAAALSNDEQLSFFVLMTCLNGHFADPALDGLGETLLKAPGGGALASWGSSGMTEPDAQAVMNQQLYRLLFGGPVALGDAVRQAKAAVGDTDARRTWVLLGDPATRLR